MTPPVSTENVSNCDPQLRIFAKLKISYITPDFSADTPFAQVKVGEIGAWLSRRNKTPTALAGAVSRGE